MCYYRLYIFLGCGHSTFSSTPVRYCVDARTERISVEEEPPESPRNENAPPITQSDQTHNPEVPKAHVPERDSTDTLASINTQPTSVASDDTGATSILSIAPPTIKERKIPCREGRAHPFHIVKIERICAVCEYDMEQRLRDRDQRLRALDESINEIKFEDWRWKLKYQGGPPTPLLQKGDRTGTDGTVGTGEAMKSVWRVSAAVGNWVKEW